MATVDDIINNAIQQANNLINVQFAVINEAINNAAGAASFKVGQDDAIDLHNIDCPSLNAPTVDIDDLFGNTLQSEKAEIQDLVNDKFMEFVDKYYPIGFEDDITEIRNILFGIINDPETVTKTVSDQSWDRARVRDEAIGRRDLDSAITETSSAGWDVPTGATVNQLFTAQQNVSNRNSTLNRDIAMNDLNISVDLIKTAIAQLVGFQPVILREAANFVDLLVRSYTIPTDNAQAIADATKDFYNQNIAFFTAQLQKQELLLKASQQETTLQLQEKQFEDEFELKTVEQRAEAAIESARTIASTASSAIGSTNSMASLTATEA